MAANLFPKSNIRKQNNIEKTEIFKWSKFLNISSIQQQIVDGVPSRKWRTHHKIRKKMPCRWACQIWACQGFGTFPQPTFSPRPPFRVPYGRQNSYVVKLPRKARDSTTESNSTRIPNATRSKFNKVWLVNHVSKSNDEEKSCNGNAVGWTGRYKLQHPTIRTTRAANSLYRALPTNVCDIKVGGASLPRELRGRKAGKRGTEEF